MSRSKQSQPDTQIAPATIPAAGQLPLFGTEGSGEAPLRPLTPPPALTRDSSLTAASEAFLATLPGRKFAPNTIEAFANDLALLRFDLGPDIPLRQIGTVDLQAFLERGMEESAWSLKTLERRIGSLKGFFRWLYETAILDWDAAAPLAYPTARSPLPKILREGEIEQLKASARAIAERKFRPDWQPLLVFTLLLETGIKREELLGIKLEHLDLVAEPPMLYIRSDNPKKAHKERGLPLPAEFREIYAAYTAQHPVSDMLIDWQWRMINHSLTTLGQSVGLKFPLSCNVLRWTYAVRQWRAGVKPDDLRLKLGLSTIEWATAEEIIRRLA